LVVGNGAVNCLDKTYLLCDLLCIKWEAELYLVQLFNALGTWYVMQKYKVRLLDYFVDSTCFSCCVL